MRGLKICLWIAGVLCLLSVIGVFLPCSALGAIAKALGVESIPKSPLMEYMVRLMLATCFGGGVYFVILARDPMKYGVLVPFTGVASLFLGVACAVVGVVAAMPLLWFLSDTISSIVLGGLILFFWRQAKSSQAQAG